MFAGLGYFVEIAFSLGLLQVACLACGPGHRTLLSGLQNGCLGEGVFRGADKELICCPGCSRSPVSPSDFWVFGGTAKFWSTCYGEGTCMECDFCFPVCTRMSGRLSVCCVCCPTRRRTSGISSESGVFYPISFCAD